MKYLVTFFALTIFASSSAFACSKDDLKSCKTKVDCEKLVGGYEFSTGACLLKINQTSSTDCSMINGNSMAKSVGGSPGAESKDGKAVAR